MNILIICTWFPPDTAIAAVRPYMMAKYLAEQGHSVTVLRSGLIHRSADTRFYAPLKNVEVLSYYGPDAPSDKVERGEEIPAAVAVKSRIDFLPKWLHSAISKTYHWLTLPRAFKNEVSGAKRRLALLTAAIDRLAGRSFDVVWSTYGELDNLWAGRYAADRFGCRWVSDFRDLVAQRSTRPWWQYGWLKKQQSAALQRADAVTCVSNDIADIFSAYCASEKVHTIYNGFDAEGSVPVAPSSMEGLSLCYTGQVYGLRAEAAVHLVRAVRCLADLNMVDLSKIRLEYAGGDSANMFAMVRRYGLDDILVDHGYVSKSEVSEMQDRSDLFLVFSWNTKSDRGIMTGKFYEGIRSGKPIVSLVAGEVPDSELFRINERYHYGFCYETACDREHFPKLCEFLAKAYRKELPASSNDELSEAFCYRHLAAQLSDVFNSLIEK